MLPDRIERHPAGGYVLLRSLVLSTLNTYIQDAMQYEAGGILLGSYRGEHIEVVSASVPHPGDKRSRFGFTRNREGHQQLAERAWIESGKTITYVGEWHTHPESIPKPSVLDLESWARDLPKRDMVLLIQGIDDLFVGVHSPFIC